MEKEVELNLALWKTKDRFIKLMEQLVPLIQKEGRQAISEEQYAEIKDLMDQIDGHKFDRKKLNQALALLGSSISKAAC